jgi:hypothetical protein
MARSRWKASFAGALLLCSAAGCAPPKPPRAWQQGGATLDIPRARWVRGELVVDLGSDGRVLVGGEHALSLDRAGRVFEPDGTPVALLEGDGRVRGPADVDLGQVGAVTAALPGHATAWLAVTATGEVVLFRPEGQRGSLGVWLGCNRSPYSAQACVLVTHLLAQRDLERQEPPPVLFGFGMAVGF